MCNMTCKKAVMLVFAIVFVLFFGSYMAFFHHGAPEGIMAQNRANRPGIRVFQDKDKHMNELDHEIAEEEREAIEYWEDFIKKNDFTPIGEIFDNCDEKDRLMVGRTIMLPDVRWGGLKGVKSRTFINTTLDAELTGGKFFLEVKYNGKVIYNKDWELCTLDEDYDDRIVYCPFNPGDHSFVKDRQIPIYLPKGRYETKGWVTDQDNTIILCGFSDFTL